MDGIINLYKPRGYTSHDAVARIKRFCGTKRVGHAGTLDPMADGVLPILVGRAAAAQEYLMNHDKRYLAGMRFGLVTDTGDITGRVISQTAVKLNCKDIGVAAENFTGKIRQIPPMYSAIKINGKKLYELAREGITVERREREIEIYKIEVLKAVTDTDFLVRVECSKGTYIRTLCEDIGEMLGCGGTLYSLTREACGEFDISDTVTLDEIERIYCEGGSSAVERFLISPEKVFTELKSIKLTDFYSRLCKNGCEIYLKKLGLDEKAFSEDQTVRLYDNEGTFFAIGKIGIFDGKTAVKAAARFAE